MVTSDYVIVIEGELDEAHRLALHPLEIAVVAGRSALVARSIDQAALHGILSRLGDLGLTILSVNASAAHRSPRGGR